MDLRSSFLPEHGVTSAKKDVKEKRSKVRQMFKRTASWISGETEQDEEVVSAIEHLQQRVLSDHEGEIEQFHAGDGQESDMKGGLWPSSKSKKHHLKRALHSNAEEQVEQEEKEADVPGAVGQAQKQTHKQKRTFLKRTSQSDFGVELSSSLPATAVQKDRRLHNDALTVNQQREKGKGNSASPHSLQVQQNRTGQGMQGMGMQRRSARSTGGVGDGRTPGGKHRHLRVSLSHSLGFIEGEESSYDDTTPDFAVGLAASRCRLGAKFSLTYPEPEQILLKNIEMEIQLERAEGRLGRSEPGTEVYKESLGTNPFTKEREEAIGMDEAPLSGDSDSHGHRGEGSTPKKSCHYLTDISGMSMTFKSIGDISLDKLIGKGAFGRVYLASRHFFGGEAPVKEGETLYAIKQGLLKDFNHPELFPVDFKNAQRTRFKNERYINRVLQHPALVATLDSIPQRTHQDCCYWLLAMEFVENGCMKTFIQKRPSVLTRRNLEVFFLDIARGMWCLHSRSPPIVHRDLFTRNILITGNNRCKIADLGMAWMGFEVVDHPVGVEWAKQDVKMFAAVVHHLMGQAQAFSEAGKSPITKEELSDVASWANELYDSWEGIWARSHMLSFKSILETVLFSMSDEAKKAIAEEMKVIWTEIGCVEELEALISETGSTEEEISSLYQTAAEFGQIEAFQMLQGIIADKGWLLSSDVRVRALTLACLNGRFEIISCLKRSEEDFASLIVTEILKSTTGVDSLTISPIAAAARHGHLEVFRLLTSCLPSESMREALISAKCLSHALKGYNRSSSMYSNREVVFSLGQLDLLTDSAVAKEALRVACKFSSDKLVSDLLNMSNMHSMVNQILTDRGTTALHVSCAEGMPQVVKLLLDSQANPNYTDFQRYTPLVIACERGNVDLVEMLIDYGADVNQPATNINLTALHVASNNNDGKEMVELLLDRGAVTQFKGTNTPQLPLASMNEEIAETILHHSGLVHSERPALVYERTAFRALDAALLPGKFEYIDFTCLPDGLDMLHEVCSYLQRNTWLETSAVTSAMVLFLAAKVVNYATKSRLQSKEQIGSLIDKDVAIFTKRCPWAAQTAVKLRRIARIVKESVEAPISSLELLDTALAELEGTHREHLVKQESVCEIGATYLSERFLVGPKMRMMTLGYSGAYTGAGPGTALGILTLMGSYDMLDRVFVVKPHEDKADALSGRGHSMTVVELEEYTVPSVLVTSDRVGPLLLAKMVDAVIVAAHTVNSDDRGAECALGTYQLAVLAKFHSIPFFVAATEFSSPSIRTSNGERSAVLDRLQPREAQDDVELEEAIKDFRLSSAEVKSRLRHARSSSATRKRASGSAVGGAPLPRSLEATHDHIPADLISALLTPEGIISLDGSFTASAPEI